MGGVREADRKPKATFNLTKDATNPGLARKAGGNVCIAQLSTPGRSPEFVTAKAVQPCYAKRAHDRDPTRRKAEETAGPWL